MTDLVPYNGQAGVGATTSAGSVLTLYSGGKTGLEAFKIDESALTEQNKRLAGLQEKDEEAYHLQVSEARAKFNQRHGWWARWRGKAEFVPPQKLDSIETRIVGGLVKVGETLVEHVGNLERSVIEYKHLATEYEKCCKEKTDLHERVTALDNEIRGYGHDREELVTVLDNLRLYSTLEQDELVRLGSSLDRYFGVNGLNLEDLDVRNNLCLLLEKGLFVSEERHETQKTDLEIAQIQLGSVDERMEKLRRNAGYIRDSYNPQRVTLARLKCQYDNLVIDAGSGCLLHRAGMIEGSVKELLDEVRQAQTILNEEIRLNMQSLSEDRLSGIPELERVLRLSGGDNEK